MIYTTNTLAQTSNLAKKLSENYKNRGGLITLQGSLGAGKTTFTQNFAKALGVSGRITSPTFVIARQYSIPNSQITLHHLDLYRLESSVELKSLSLDELISDPNNLILIEWPEKIANLDQLPTTTQVTISIPSPNTREFTIINYT